MDRALSRPAVPPLSSARLPASRFGYSIVELVVALVIVGVVAALGLPKIRNITNQNRVLRGAQALQVEVQQAFALAGRNRAPVTVSWNSSVVELQVADRAGSTVYRRANLRGYGLEGVDVSVTPAVLTVFPNGIAGDSLLIRVSKSGYSRVVRVSRAGMVRVQ